MIVVFILVFSMGFRTVEEEILKGLSHLGKLLERLGKNEITFLKSGMLWGSNKTLGLDSFEKGIEECVSKLFL